MYIKNYIDQSGLKKIGVTFRKKFVIISVNTPIIKINNHKNIS